MIINKKRVGIDKALQELGALMSDWGLNNDQYVLVDEFAYVLQGYEAIGTEVKTGHLDVYVNPNLLPWKDKNKRSIIPSKESKHMKDWIKFMDKTGYALDILKASRETFDIPTVEYEFAKNRKIKLMRAYEMTNAFVEQTLLHYSLEDVGEEKISEWLEKLGLIEKAAVKKKYYRIAKLCRVKHKEALTRWKFARN